MKLNKTRQKLYLDGKVGLINDGTVEQLREVTNDRDYMGKFTYYHKNRIFPSDAPLDNVQYHPISWFYENETDLPSDSALVGKVAKALLLGLEKQPEHFAVGDLLRKLDIETEEKE